MTITNEQFEALETRISVLEGLEARRDAAAARASLRFKRESAFIKSHGGLKNRAIAADPKGYDAIYHDVQKLTDAQVRAELAALRLA